MKTSSVLNQRKPEIAGKFTNTVCLTMLYSAIVLLIALQLRSVIG